MSATEELRALLDKRGVEWSTNETLTDCWTRWDADKFRCTATEINGIFAFSVGNSTPEQAIAATLGAIDAKPTQAEPSGTLTAEKVRELMEDNSRQYQSPTDPYVWLTEYDWQAIADELNATLGRGTCTLSRGTSGLMHVTTGHCSECGAEVVKGTKDGYRSRYCQWCGAKVVEA